MTALAAALFAAGAPLAGLLLGAAIRLAQGKRVLP